jgi:hypothetical protein
MYRNILLYPILDSFSPLIKKLNTSPFRGQADLLGTSYFMQQSSS